MEYIIEYYKDPIENLWRADVRDEEDNVDIASCHYYFDDVVRWR